MISLRLKADKSIKSQIDANMGWQGITASDQSLLSAFGY
jgi:hypothetical protein